MRVSYAQLDAASHPTASELGQWLAATLLPLRGGKHPVVGDCAAGGGGGDGGGGSGDGGGTSGGEGRGGGMGDGGVPTLRGSRVVSPPRVVVVVALPVSVDYYVAVLACIRLGITFAPVDPCT